MKEKILGENKILLSNPTIRKRTAYHEAGHFVLLVAYSAKLRELPRIHRISIAPENSMNLGYVRMASIAAGAEQILNLAKTKATELLEEAIRRIQYMIYFNLAGIASELLWMAKKKKKL